MSLFINKFKEFIEKVYENDTEIEIVRQLEEYKNLIIKNLEKGKDYLKRYYKENQKVIDLSCSEEFKTELNNLINSYQINELQDHTKEFNTKIKVPGNMYMTENNDQTSLQYSDSFDGVIDQEFDTKLVKDLNDLSIGDEVFRLGIWYSISKKDHISVILVDSNGKKVAMPNTYITKTGLMKKVLLKEFKENLNSLNSKDPEYILNRLDEYFHVCESSKANYEWQDYKNRLLEKYGANDWIEYLENTNSTGQEEVNYAKGIIATYQLTSSISSYLNLKESLQKENYLYRPNKDYCYSVTTNANIFGTFNNKIYFSSEDTAKNFVDFSGGKAKYSGKEKLQEDKVNKKDLVTQLTKQLESKLKDFDWYYMMSDSNKVRENGGFDEREIASLKSKLDQLTDTKEGTRLFNKYCKYPNKEKREETTEEKFSSSFLDLFDTIIKFGNTEDIEIVKDEYRKLRKEGLYGAELAKQLKKTFEVDFKRKKNLQEKDVKIGETYAWDTTSVKIYPKYGKKISKEDEAEALTKIRKFFGLKPRPADVAGKNEQILLKSFPLDQLGNLGIALQGTDLDFDTVVLPNTKTEKNLVSYTESKKPKNLLEDAYEDLKKKHPDWNWSEAEEVSDDDLEAAGDLYDRTKRKELGFSLMNKEEIKKYTGKYYKLPEYKIKGRNHIYYKVDDLKKVIDPMELRLMQSKIITGIPYKDDIELVKEAISSNDSVLVRLRAKQNKKPNKLNINTNTSTKHKKELEDFYSQYGISPEEAEANPDVHNPDGSIKESVDTSSMSAYENGLSDKVIKRLQNFDPYKNASNKVKNSKTIIDISDKQFDILKESEERNLIKGNTYFYDLPESDVHEEKEVVYLGLKDQKYIFKEKESDKTFSLSSTEVYYEIGTVSYFEHYKKKYRIEEIDYTPGDEGMESDSIEFYPVGSSDDLTDAKQQCFDMAKKQGQKNTYKSEFGVLPTGFQIVLN